MQNGAVSVRLRNNQDLGGQPVAEFMAMAQEAVAQRRDL
jgi:hypothetical protein